MPAWTCPRCDLALEPRINPLGLGAERVDQCRHCGGLWIDGPAIVAVAPTLAYFLLRHARERAPTPPTQGGIGGCPACEASTLQIDGCGVRMDACPACNGVWLDGGELGAVRRYGQSSEEARAATDAAVGVAPVVIDGVVCTVCSNLVERACTWVTDNGLVCNDCHDRQGLEWQNQEPGVNAEHPVLEAVTEGASEVGKTLAEGAVEVGGELLLEGIFEVLGALIEGALKAL